MADVTGICNRALQKVGVKKISSISENSAAANACLRCYEEIRDSVLMSHRWVNAIKRMEIAEDATAPAWGRLHQYTLPSDYLKLIAPYPEMDDNGRDWVVENGKILTNDSSPIYLRYVGQITDPNEMGPLLREAIACKMAVEMVEELTQSNSKKSDLETEYEKAIAIARKASAIQNIPQEAVEDTWISIRQ